MAIASTRACGQGQGEEGKGWGELHTSGHDNNVAIMQCDCHIIVIATWLLHEH